MYCSRQFPLVPVATRGGLSERLAEIVQCSADAIVRETLLGVVETWNAGAERLYGYSAQEMIGRSTAALLPPGRGGEEAARLGRLRRGEWGEDVETVRLRKDGTDVGVSLRLSPIHGPEGMPIAVSHIARGAARRRSMEERLRPSAKQECIAVMAGGGAHRFNNLLVGIMGNASLALAEVPLSSPLHPLLEGVIGRIRCRGCFRLPTTYGWRSEGRVHAMAATAGMPVRADHAIRSDVVTELRWDPQITASDIAVAVKDGVVSLSGFVPSYWEKDAAEQAAKRVYGVRGVANDIQVKPASVRTDPENAREAVQALESHVLLPADQIKVSVRHGWVTLEGAAKWGFQKRLAESAVRKLNGVVGITNNIEVKPKLPTSQVMRRIEEAFERSADLDARRIAVEVEDDGTVKLYGSVRSFTEKHDAERAAWCAPGVRKVENHLAIIP